MSHETVRAQLEERRRVLSLRMGKIGQHLRSPGDADWKEQAQARENDEVLEALDDSGRGELDALNAAIGRVDAGTYGECASCGHPIAARRLEALPTTSLCIECAS